jgi:hypothetical protein
VTNKNIFLGFFISIDWFLMFNATFSNISAISSTHTNLSPIRRGFAPDFGNYKKGCTRLAAASDKVSQLLAHGRWFSPGTLASTNKNIFLGFFISIDWFLMFNATFSNISAISWRPVLVVEEARVPGENHRPWEGDLNFIRLGENPRLFLQSLVQIGRVILENTFWWCFWLIFALLTNTKCKGHKEDFEELWHRVSPLMKPAPRENYTCTSVYL